MIDHSWGASSDDVSTYQNNPYYPGILFIDRDITYIWAIQITIRPLLQARDGYLLRHHIIYRPLNVYHWQVLNLSPGPVPILDVMVS